MKTSIENFGSQGLVSVEYPKALRQAVEESVELWKKFCDLPESVRAQFPYNSGEGMRVGYELKKTQGATLDIKEDFHFTRGAKQWLIEQSKKLNDPTIVEFVASLNRLVELMNSTVAEFAQAVERVYEMPGFTQEISENSDQWFMRFLHYFGGAQPGEEIAKAHADKSGFTFHLYESDPGLEYLDRKHHWQDMPVSAGETVIIPGMRGQYCAQGKLKATWHRVVATSQTAKHGRFSAVAFIHPSFQTPQYNKAGMGRLQEFEPGFNYEMPFEEFAKLFK